MTNGEATTFRLAIGLFGEIAPLISALSALSTHGVMPRNLCLVGLTHTVRAALCSKDCDQSAADLRSFVEHTQERQSPFGGLTCAVGNGGFPAHLCAACFSAPASAGTHLGWLSAPQSKRLQDHLDSNGLVLIVSSETPAGQDASSRILLKHSKHGVQTHDFTLRITDLLPTPAGTASPHLDRGQGSPR